MEVTNSGITAIAIPPTPITRSCHRPTRAAAYTPAAIDSGTTSTNATAASFTEFPSAPSTYGATGARYA